MKRIGIILGGGILLVIVTDVIPEKNPIPGAVVAIQTFGDVLGFNPHCHILVTEGCFYAPY
jgi:hypothetical protein